MTLQDRRLIGWREWVSLPGLGIRWIKVKVDTGAKTSALHAFDIEPFSRGGKPYVRFQVHPLQRQAQPSMEAVAEVLEYRVVRTSGGHQSLRPVIRADIELAGERWPIELTLVGRDMMAFRMLLGREAVAGRFLVDSASSYVLGKVPGRGGA